MRAHWFILSVLMHLAVLSMHAQEFRVRGDQPSDPRIRCFITVHETEWKTPGQTSITIDVENVSDEDAYLDASATLTARTKLSSNNPGAGSLWAPIDIRHDSSAQTDERSPGAIRLRHPKVHIAKHSTARFRIHAANVKWENEMSSIWPNRKLFNLIADGQYFLQLTISSDEGEIASNAVTVDVSKLPARRTDVP